mgnify:CR=1 FL=1
MKRVVFLTAAFCLLSLAAFAQEKPADYSGTWNLDISKSKLDERSRIESMKLTVTQTEKDITVVPETKRQAPPDGGMGRGGRAGLGGDSTLTYSLDGKETKTELASAMGTVPVTLKATSAGGKLTLTSTRTFNTQMGEMTMTTKEVWSLSADGKTLTVEREQQTPRGTNAATHVFTKQ